MTHNDSQVEAVMALVEEYGQSKWCEGLADGVFDRRGSRDYADVAAEEFAAISAALSALAAGKVEAADAARYRRLRQLAEDPGAFHIQVVDGASLDAAVDASISASPSPLSADPESAVVGARQHGFTRDDLECIAEGLEKGYERTVNVGNTTGEGDEHLESTTAAAARFIRAAIAPTLPHPALDRANAGEREREGMQVRQIEDCPELNLSNYDAVDVERLNDWAIRADAEIERLAADPERREGAEGVLVGASVSSPFNKLNGNAYGVPAASAPGEIIGWQWRRACQAWPEKLLHSEPALTAPDTEKRAIYAGATVAYGVSVPIPHTFAPPDADTDDSMEGGKNG